MSNINEIVLFQPNELISLEVLLFDDTVWLNRRQIATLFDRDVKTIGKHINNALKEELAMYSVVAKFATTAKDGKVYQIEHYNLDMILSVGYRVKSNRGIQYRIWANNVLKDYVIRGYAVNQRFENLENRVSETEKKIDFFIKTSLPPVQGVFYSGQIFDAYEFASKLIKSAKKRIVLLDNYVDETVLMMLSKRKVNVSAEIYSKKISKQLQLDLQQHNTQYEPITIQTSSAFHDRFFIIDNTVYHIGASLKDLGKKMFAFSKMEIPPTNLLKNI